MGLRLGLVGCGDIVGRYYLPALKALAEDGLVELVGCCDKKEEKAKEVCRVAGFAGYDTDWHRMLTAKTPDAVLIAVPVECTADLVIEMAEFGIPIMLEKPPALTVEKAEELRGALANNHILHQVAYNRHFMPLAASLKKKLQKERELQNIHIQMSRIKRLESTFYTTAIHSIDLLRFLADAEYKKVDFHYQELQKYGENVANYFLHAQFANGVTGQISILVDSGMVHERVMAVCEGTTYTACLPVWECADSPGRIEKYQADKLIECEMGEFGGNALENAKASGFYGEISNFIVAVQNGIQPVESVDFSIPLIEIAQKLHRREKEYRKHG